MRPFNGHEPVWLTCAALQNGSVSLKAFYLYIYRPILSHREESLGGSEKQICFVQLHVEGHIGDVRFRRPEHASVIFWLVQRAIKLEQKNQYNNTLSQKR